MIIEKLKIEDISQVLDLHKSIVPYEFSEEEAVQIYKDMSLNEKYYLAVAKEDNKIIGTAMGICCDALAGPFLVIEDVVVKEGLRGKGIGRRLMESLDEFAKEKKCAYAILVSSGFRKEAHKFYENVGFTESVRGFRKMY